MTALHQQMNRLCYRMAFDFKDHDRVMMVLKADAKTPDVQVLTDLGDAVVNLIATQATPQRNVTREGALRYHAIQGNRHLARVFGLIVRSLPWPAAAAPQRALPCRPDGSPAGLRLPR